MQNCSHNLEAWKVATAWYADEQKDLYTALTVINKAITIHKDSQHLHTEAIKLQLSIVNELDNDEKEKSEVCGKIYADFIGKFVNDVKFLIQILDILSKYPFTLSVQNLVIDKLKESPSDQDLVWHTLAQREMRGMLMIFYFVFVFHNCVLDCTMS